MSYFDIFKTGAMAFVTIGNCISSPLSVIPMVILIITNDQEKMKYVLDMVHNTSGEKPYVTKYNDPEFLES